jgi:outer membrane protein OmpU
MKSWKKAGVTALASSLVATSAFAGAATVSGSANMTYTANSGAQDTTTTTDQYGQDGQRWGLNKSITFAGSGEMDNGWTVSISHTLLDGTSTGVGMTLDMGDAGTLDYQGDAAGSRGIGKIKDKMPTADDGVDNGLDANGTTAAGGVSGTVTGGATGFHYSKSMDMISIGLGYMPKGGSTNTPGGVGGAGASASSVSGFVSIDPMDGLEIGFGVGEKATAKAGDNSQTDDMDTVYATYVYGPLTVGYQVSNTDTYSTTADDEMTRWGILYAVNDELSISYQDHTNDDTTATDEEASGWAASYTVGSMTFKAHRNKGTNLGNATGQESEHTEIGVTFAF